MYLCYNSRMLFYDAMIICFCRGRSPLRPETGITLISWDAEDCVPYRDITLVHMYEKQYTNHHQFFLYKQHAVFS